MYSANVTASFSNLIAIVLVFSSTVRVKYFVKVDREFVDSTINDQKQLDCICKDQICSQCMLWMKIISLFLFFLPFYLTLFPDMYHGYYRTTNWCSTFIYSNSCFINHYSHYTYHKFWYNFNHYTYRLVYVTFICNVWSGMMLTSHCFFGIDNTLYF